MMKRHFLVLMAALLMVAMNMNAQSPKRGDVNGDGSVDVSDVTALVSMILSNSTAVTAADINKDGNVDVSDVTALVAIILNPVLEEHEYVDLGLPSGTLWSTTNLGAETPGEYGNYFAWGETATKTDYSWEQYKWGTEDNITKYTTSGCTLEAADDAAVKFCGAEWQMPTKAQLEELDANCTWEVYALNGKNVMKGTGPNGNCIYIPFAGTYSGTSHSVGAARLWGNTLSGVSRSAYALSMYSNDATHLIQNIYRYSGHSIRPVSTKKAVRVTGITLSSTAEELMVGETCTLTATVAPAGAWTKDIVWTSSDEEVAAVDADGMVTALSIGFSVITATAADGSGVVATCEVAVTYGEHDYVDLGLPSGTLWATTNIGAKTPEGYGFYYAWGETKTKEEYTEDTHVFYVENRLIKYCTRSPFGNVDNLIELEPEDDAATVNWGGGWCIPSPELWNELIAGCNWQDATLNGVPVLKGESLQNGNIIYLPYGGVIEEEVKDFVNGYGFYWASTINTEDPWFGGYVSFRRNQTPQTGTTSRYVGHNVRAISTEKALRVTEITLSASKATLSPNSTLQLSALFTPEDAWVTTLTWSSDNEEVATVDATGKVTAVGGGSCTIIATATDGSGVTAICKVSVPEYVDLGLPSGTLWATTNVGAMTEYEFGDYFAWGETTPKREFTWSTYTLCEGTYDTMMKYCDDEAYCTECDPDYLYMLDPEDDAATANWGSDWCIPSPTQWQELANECMWYCGMNEDGVKYLRVEAMNGNSILLPLTGYKNGTTVSDTGKKGHFVSSLIDPTLPTNATTFSVPYKSGGSTYASTFTEARYYGYTVRPVKKQPQVQITDIVLTKSSVDIELGDYRVLYATPEPANATMTKLKWSTSNVSVASVVNGVVTARAKGTCTITALATDGSGVMTSCTVKVIDPRPYVDLGLPSGTLWATMNVGAAAASQFGDYFAWGETEPKGNYTWANNKWVADDECLLRYCTDTNHGYAGSFKDNLVKLIPSDDAVTQNWGNNWRTPTKEEWDELLDAANTMSGFTTYSSVKVLRVASKKNNKNLYLPAQGYYDGSSCVGSTTEGCYWSSEINPEEGGDTAFRLYFNSSETNTSDARRGYGYPVRAVAVKKVTHVTEIILTPSKTGVLDPDDTITLSATIVPADADFQTLNWSSNNTAVATVTPSGTVKALAEGRATIRAAASSGATATYIVRVAVPHTYVDLALPSGTLWATMNVGATTEEGEGDFFAWGETEPKTNYAASTYKHCETDMNHVTKYFDTDNLTRLQPEDDAATVNWGSTWVMPTKDEMQELVDHCTFALETVNGVEGVRFTGTNGNSIFFPKAGYKTGTGSGQAGSRARVWTSDLAETPFVAWSLITADNSALTYSIGRVSGLSVRPVSVTKVGRVTSVSLSSTQKTLDKGQTTTLTATVAPSTAENRTIVWSSDNEEVATVNASGVVTAVGGGICTITATAIDGSGKQGTCQVTVYEYVDLGLPSGALWATTNVGAATKEASGDYFAWGETTTKTSFSWSNYAWCNGSSSTMTKYCPLSNYGYNGYSDTNIALLQADDAAAQNWGGNWRMPTLAEWNELINTSYVTRQWITTENGVNGLLLTSKTDTSKSIFLPAAGYKTGTSVSSPTTYGSYWTMGVRDNVSYQASYGYFNQQASAGYSTADRYKGNCIRPVKVVPVSSLTLNATNLLLKKSESYTLKGTVTPSDATDKSLFWRSSNTEVATVTGGGKVTAVGGGTATIMAIAKDGSGKKYSCTVTVDNAVDLKGHEYVDLGLPSGLLWAACNVGAGENGLAGDYVAWGGTAEFDPLHPNFDWAHCPYWASGESNSTLQFSKYVGDSQYGTEDDKTVLEPIDDVAHVRWGGDWRMPTNEEWQELKDNCTWTWSKKLNGEAGYTVKGSNGNSIYLYAGSYYDSHTHALVEEGDYWSSSAMSETFNYYAQSFSFKENNYSSSLAYRKNGLNVRAVASCSVKLVTGIQLSATEKKLTTGGTYTLTATVSPSNAWKKTLTWTTSDSSVATVDANGKVTARGGGICYITATAKDGSQVSAKCKVKVAKEVNANGHQYVDLGLPSGTLWATVNVGGNAYFEWGGTAIHPDGTGNFYTWESYPFATSGDIDSNVKFSKYNTQYQRGPVDYKTILDLADDAAHVQWGGDWRIPTKEEWDELNNSAYCTWTQGMYSYTVTSVKYPDRSITIPLYGYRTLGSAIMVNTRGYYWTSTLYSPLSYEAYYFNISNGNHYTSTHGRNEGLSIRAVIEPTN